MFVRSEGLEIGKVLAQGRIGPPDAFARNGILERKTANIGRKRPTVFRWQMLKALHGRAVEPLVDHLIKREQAALARTLCVSEGDRRRIHSNRLQIGRANV